MSGILLPIQSILTQLKTLVITNGDNQTTTPYVRVWNNQIKRQEEGSMEAFPLPAFFLHLETPLEWNDISQGFHDVPATFKVHIAHEFYDAQDGTMEQDLAVFALRDQVVACLNLFKPGGMGPFTLTYEEHDVNHANVYELILGFKANITDSRGSKYDPDNPRVITVPGGTIPPDIAVTKDVGGGAPVRHFTIPKRQE